MKIITTIGIILTAISFYSCQTPIVADQKGEEYDIALFFQNEISKLKKENPTINKTVSNGKSTGTKQVKISDWNKELAHFTELNLNKIRAHGLEKIINGDTTIFTSSNDSKERTIIKLVYNAEAPQEITVYKELNNLLFNNQEQLYYKTNNVYEIIKRQRVKGMGENLYHIKGEILN